MTKVNLKVFKITPKPNSRRSYTALKSKESLAERLKFLAKKEAKATEIVAESIDQDETYYFPELDGVLVHLDESKQKYKTKEEAIAVAEEIKRTIQSSIAQWTTPVIVFKGLPIENRAIEFETKEGNLVKGYYFSGDNITKGFYDSEGEEDKTFYSVKEVNRWRYLPKEERQLDMDVAASDKTSNDE